MAIPKLQFTCWQIFYHFRSRYFAKVFISARTSPKVTEHTPQHGSRRAGGGAGQPDPAPAGKPAAESRNTFKAQPLTLNTQLKTFNGLPPTLNTQLKTFNSQPLAFNTLPKSFNGQPLTLHTQPKTFNSLPLTFKTQPKTFNGQPLAFNT